MSLRLVRISLTCAFAVLAFSSPAWPQSFLIEPSGQADRSSCQSYALAAALAFKQDPNFPINTAAELRQAEIGIRAEIEEAAGSDDVSHAHIATGFKSYTRGRYELRTQTVDEPTLGDEVGLRTGVTSKEAVPPTVLLGQVVKELILTSTTRILGSAYGEGHIVALLGVSGPPNSNREFLVLNSAVRAADGTRKNCQNGLPDDPGPYEGSLSWISSGAIHFKKFGDKHLVWRVVRP